MTCPFPQGSVMRRIWMLHRPKDDEFTAIEEAGLCPYCEPGFLGSCDCIDTPKLEITLL